VWLAKIEGWFDVIHPELKTHCDRLFIAQSKFEEARIAHNKATASKQKTLNWLAGVAVALGLLRIVGIIDLEYAAEVTLVVVICSPFAFVLLKKSRAEKKLSEERHRRFIHMDQLRKELPDLRERLQNKYVSQLERDMILVDWQGKPAVVFSGSHAYAIVKPEGDWMEVDGTSVLNTGKIISGAETFDQMFKEQYGYLGSVQKFPAKLVWEDEADMFDDRKYLAYLERQRNLAGG
jgi:hypothetical protein